MSRNSTQALHNIRMLCRIQQVDEKILYERSRLILSIYRDVCWSAIGRAEEVHEDLIYNAVPAWMVLLSIWKLLLLTKQENDLKNESAACLKRDGLLNWWIMRWDESGITLAGEICIV